MVTEEQCQAASQAVGRDVSAHEVGDAMDPYQEYSLDKLKAELAKLEKLVAANKGRVMNLTHVVNDMKIAIAAREVVGANDPVYH